MYLDYDKINNLPDNAMLKVKPELYYEWDFEKNTHLDIWKISKGSNKKSWWICKDCGSSYDVVTCGKIKGVKCSYCSGRKVNHTNSLRATHPRIADLWDYDKNGDRTPDNLRYGSHDKVWWKCLECECSYDMIISNKTIHNQGCPYCSGQRVSDSNCLATVHPKLSKEWDYELNTVTPKDITCKTKNKYWWKCRICDISYESTTYNRINGHGCPYCSGRKVKEEDSIMIKHPYLADSWIHDKNEKMDLVINKIAPNSNLRPWWKCKKGHEWRATVSSRTKGRGCPYCLGQKAIKGETDLWTTHPHVASLLVNIELAHKYMKGSNAKVDWKCPDCNSIINKRIHEVTRKGLSCQSCGDGFSYPHKFMYNLLTSIGVDFETEKSFKWSNKKRYDFYVPSLNMIIETHGAQHLDKGFESIGGRTWEEEKENDRYKREMANKNGVINYFEINCKKSNLEWIKSSIMNSDICNLLNFENVDWIDVSIKSEKSFVKNVWDLSKENLLIRDIADITKLNRATVRNYIRRGKELGVIK